jgi:vacuolar-type H+-ATPase subunit C/Vma6
MVRFAYAVGRIRALEGQLLDESRIIRMVEARDFAAAYLILRELPSYAEKFEHGEHAFDFEPLLQRELQSVYSLLDRLAPGNELLAVIRKQHDPALPLAEYLELLRRQAANSSLRLFKKYARGYILLNQLKFDLLQGKVEADSARQKFRYTEYHRAVDTGLEHFKRSGSLHVLEREIDNQLVDTVKAAKYRVFGLEPLIGYLIAKEIEVKTVRLILTAKRMHVDNQAIKERLRLPYV